MTTVDVAVGPHPVWCRFCGAAEADCVCGFFDPTAADPALPAVPSEREVIEFWLPEQPVSLLMNANDRKWENIHVRRKGSAHWQNLMRGQLDHTFVIERATIIVRYFKCSLHQADVGNYYLTAKAITDGLVRKPDERGVMQDGFLPDDNDRRILGPFQFRGLDPSLRSGRKQFVRVKVEIRPIGPLVERWWEPEMSLPLDLPWM